jgi:hypothetical protein
MLEALGAPPKFDTGALAGSIEMRSLARRAATLAEAAAHRETARRA